MIRWLRPKEAIAAPDTEHGMRMLVLDAVFAQSMTVLTTGAFLYAFGLLLGASNIVIGFLAALSTITQTLQIPAILLVEKLRWRKAIAIFTISISRLSLIGIAVLPWIMPLHAVLLPFVLLLLVYFGMGAIGGCAFNSWFRDIVPDNRINYLLTRRLTWATFFGALLSLVGAYGIDLSEGYRLQPINAYCILFIIGSVSGMISVVYLIRTPEPRMPALGNVSMLRLLAEPIKDRNYRNFLIFLGAWNFALNFAMPFYAVYMIKELHLSMTWVLGLTVLGQLVNVVFFGIWGKLSDRYSNKSVLLLSVPWFFCSFLIWPFTTLPGPHVMTIPLLIAAHILSGISIAGVNLCAGNLAFKSAPFGRAASYLAVNALVSGVAATISPILAGFAADTLGPYELRLALSWGRWEERLMLFDLPAIDLQGMDFIFIFGFVFGLYSFHRLLPVREKGEVSERVLRDAFFAETFRMVRQVSTLTGMRQLLSVVPFPILNSPPKNGALKKEEQ